MGKPQLPFESLTVKSIQNPFNIKNAAVPKAKAMATIQAEALGSIDMGNKSIDNGIGSDNTSPIKPSSSPHRNFNKTSRRTMPKIGR